MIESETLAAIAKHYGFTIRDSGYRSCDMRRVDGFGLYFHETNGRYEIKACGPKREGDWYAQQSFPSITVNATKTVAQIIADIDRRLMPEYIANWDAAIENREQHRAYVADCETFRTKLQAIIEDERMQYLPLQGDGYAVVSQVTTSCKIEFHVSGENAFKLAALIRAWRK